MHNFIKLQGFFLTCFDRFETEHLNSSQTKMSEPISGEIRLCRLRVFLVMILRSSGEVIGAYASLFCLHFARFGQMLVIFYVFLTGTAAGSSKQNLFMTDAEIFLKYKSF